MITPGLPLALLAAQAIPAPSGAASFFPIVVQFGLIIAIIYFVMFRPQQKKRQLHETALKALKRGDEVVTFGGIVGTVIHIAETSKDGGANRLDDRVTLKSGESRLIIERGRIERVGASVQSVASTTASSASAE